MLAQRCLNAAVEVAVKCILIWTIVIACLLVAPKVTWLTFPLAVLTAFWPMPRLR